MTTLELGSTGGVFGGRERKNRMLDPRQAFLQKLLPEFALVEPHAPDPHQPRPESHRLPGPPPREPAIRTPRCSDFPLSRTPAVDQVAS
jgi:hypothetical protein